MKNTVEITSVIRDIWTATTQFKPTNEIPAIERIEVKPTFIRPRLRVIKPETNQPFIVIAAPGAVGKTTFAKYCAHEKKGLYWDLSKIRLGSNTFIGTLAQRFGPASLTGVLQGIADGSVPMFFDAFDEAEIISGWEGVETFVKDVHQYSRGSRRPSIMFFSRTETAGLIQILLDELASGTELYSLYEIDYFEKESAIQFIEESLKSKGDLNINSHRGPFINAVENIFTCIGMGIHGEADNWWDIPEVRSFIGYSPVLQTIASYLLNQNYAEIANNFAERKSVSQGILVIRDFIRELLKREQQKVINALKHKTLRIPTGWDDWEIFYSEAQQLQIITTYLVGGRKFDRSINKDAPNWLQNELNEAIQNFLPNHPFLKNDTFSSPAFRDYTFAYLLSSSTIEDQCLRLIDKGSFVTTPLLSYFYQEFGNHHCVGTHAGVIYDSAISKQSLDNDSMLTFVKADDGVHKLEIINNNGSSMLNLEFECLINNDYPLIFDRRVQNATINIKGKLILGRTEKSIELQNIDINADKIILRANECILNCFSERSITIQAREFEQVDHNLALKLLGNGKVEINWPTGNIYPWIDHYVEIQNHEIGDYQDEMYALRRILEPFRKHGKGELSKHFEYINNVIIKGNEMRQNMLAYLIDEGIITKNSGNHQYYANEEIINQKGINWGNLKSINQAKNEKLKGFLSGFVERFA